ncbi:hypothetical protein [Nitrospira lenta]|uniref:Uncharacterized protein n=1 Tax=Nitrospira lenta TaxID=1436998 RepID=A0A330L6U4_9BACT|nr:hypothetical protein [Nitrospira lenta]SPP64892.1 exported hypothetical protein [Nitrospira lenta]
MTVTKRKGSSLMLRRYLVAIGGWVLLMSIAGVTAPASSYADEPLPAAAASYPTGKVTSVYETTFQIDGRTVGLAPEAVLVDRHGDPLQPAALRVDIDVKYHIQKGTTDKIDWMLLVLPE